MRALTREDMALIFSVTDRLGVHREQLKVLLVPLGDGRVERLSGGKIRITVPASSSVAEWLPVLEKELAALYPPID